MQALERYEPYIIPAQLGLIICMDDRNLDIGQRLPIETEPQDALYNQIAGGAAGATTDRLIVEESWSPLSVIEQGISLKLIMLGLM